MNNNLLVLATIVLVSALPFTAGASGSCNDNVVQCLYVNVTGVDPSSEELQNYQQRFDEFVSQQNSSILSGLETLAREMISNQAEFQTVRLKGFASGWTHKDGLPGSPLNDTILTIIASVMTDLDYRRIMYDDLIAKGSGTPVDPDKLKLPDGVEIFNYYSRANDHYLDLEREEAYHKAGFVSLGSQSPLTHKNPEAIAGILSLRGFGSSAYLAGTNRRAIPMILREATCLDLDSIRDTTITEKYILRDVSRIGAEGVVEFKNRCKSCHGLLDQVTTAFAYYDVSAGGVSGNAVVYDEPEEVTASLPSDNKLMKVVSTTGYIPKNDFWVTEFTEAQLDHLGWPADQKQGFGAKAFGRAVSESDAFSHCQPRKVFQAVCGRDPVAYAKEDDLEALRSAVKTFRSNGYQLKPVFANLAAYCALKQVRENEAGEEEL